MLNKARVEWPKTLDMVASIAMTIVSCLLIVKLVWSAGPTEASVPSDPLPIDDAASEGDPAAPVAIIEFSDFQCPFVALFASRVLPDLRREFIETGKVRLVLRHLPLEVIHPAARPAAIAAACAGEQGRFWELHDALFRINKGLDPEAVQALTQGIPGVDSEAHAECAETRGPAAVAADLELAAALGVRSTPMFFVGVPNGAGGVRVTQRLAGAVGIGAFREAVEAALRDGAGSRQGQ
jgi:protein-disulfide isomerase